jgi:ElaB/YqjD/DUF883 family membrane-anchored ribosome-binding protein
LRTLGAQLSPENLERGAKEVVQEAKNAATETLKEAKNAATEAFAEVKDSAVEAVSTKVNEWKDDIRQVERETLGFVRENAVPLAFIGVGLGWFFLRRRSRESHWDREYRWGAAGEAARGYPTYSDRRASALPRAQGRARELTHEVGERARGWVETAEHTASDVSNKVRDFAHREFDEARNLARSAEHRVSEAATRARDVAGQELRQAREFSMHALETHPLAVGAGILAAGIGVGLALPQTRREAELLGPRRERLVDGAKGLIEDLSQTATQTARDVKESIVGPGA